MYREFQNLALECWLHDGPKLGITEHGICLRAESEVCQTLVRALEELAAMDPPAKLALGLKPSQRRNACSSIRLRLLPESKELRQMSLRWDGDRVIFEFTPRGLESFKDAVIRWRNGSEDFSVCPKGPKRELGEKDVKSVEVWFWNFHLGS